MNTKNSNSITFSKWDTVSKGVPQGSILGPLLFLIYIHNLLPVVNKKSIPILYADDASVLITSPKPTDLKRDVVEIFHLLINTWFNSNLLTLNLETNHPVQFKTKNVRSLNLQIGYQNKCITNASHTTFLGISIESTLLWNNHVERLANKLDRAFYVIRILKIFMTVESIIATYHAYFLSLMMYGLIFWGSSSYSDHIFKLQKKVIRGIRNTESCGSYFTNLKILPPQPQYVVSIIQFIVLISIYHSLESLYIRKECITWSFGFLIAYL
jgi:hypothetical protein